MFLEVLSHLMWGQDGEKSIPKSLFEENRPREYSTYG